MCLSKRCRSTACAVSTDTRTRAFDLDLGWRLHDQVSVRPERFGALLYHFGTRRLSFLKDPTLLAVVQGLGECATAREACTRAGVPVEELPRYRAALSTLAQSRMISTRES
jgi:mycofactocin biosynthesis protein MftB